MVLCSHQFALLFMPEPRPLGLFTLGTLGVLIFFVVSGYLVAQSWDRDANVWRFALRRFLRIWPGLAVVVALTVFVAGPIFTSLPLRSYFQEGQTWKYFGQLVLSVELYLPGVFQDNVWKVVNGSLWTIPIEVRWYGILMLAGMLGLLHVRMRHLLLAVILGYAGYIFLIFDVQHNPAASFPQPAFGCEYGCFFCYGAVLFRWQSYWRRRPGITLLGLCVVSALALACGYRYLAVYLLLPFLVIWFGNLSTPVLSQAGRFGDLSYGIYIYAYLVQQSVIAMIGYHHSYGLTLVLSVVVTVACAIASWHLVEKPALSLKRNLGSRQRDDLPGAIPAPSAKPVISGSELP